MIGTFTSYVIMENDLTSLRLIFHMCKVELIIAIIS